MTSLWISTTLEAGCQASSGTVPSSSGFGGAGGGCMASTSTRRHTGTRALLATTMWISSRSKGVLTSCKRHRCSL